MLNFLKGILPHAFPTSDEEAEFRKIHHNPGEIRKAILFGMIVYCLFLALDHILFPEYFTMILFIRAGIILPVLLILFFTTFITNFYRFSALIIIGISAFSAAGIILIEYIVRDNIYSELYFYGIAQVLIIFFGTGKLNFLPSLICGFGIVIPAVIIDSVFIETDILRILTKSIFMFTMAVLGLIASSIIQNTARARFNSHKKIEELSMTDSLTGLKNRHFYQSVIIDEIVEHLKITAAASTMKGERASDNKQNYSYAFIMLDIDYFKKINDKYGHDVGDQVLKEFSDRILRLIRTNDSLIRWGGEEFLLLLRYLRVESLEPLINRIKEEISEKPFEFNSSTEKITVSGGVFLIPSDSPGWIKSADDILELADKALYFSKENGRDRFTQVIFEQPVSFNSPVFKTISESDTVHD